MRRYHWNPSLKLRRLWNTAEKRVCGKEHFFVNLRQIKPPSMLCQGGLRQWRDGHRAGRVEWNRWTKPRYSWNQMLNVVAQGFALNPNSDTWSGSYSTGWRRWNDNFERCNQGPFRKEVRIFSLSLIICSGFIEIWIYGFSIFARKSVERESDTIQRFSSMRSPRTRLLINSKRYLSTGKEVNQQQKILLIVKLSSSGQRPPSFLAELGKAQVHCNSKMSNLLPLFMEI